MQYCPLPAGDCLRNVVGKPDSVIERQFAGDSPVVLRIPLKSLRRIRDVYEVCHLDAGVEIAEEGFGERVADVKGIIRLGAIGIEESALVPASGMVRLVLVLVIKIKTELHLVVPMDVREIVGDRKRM